MGFASGLNSFFYYLCLPIVVLLGWTWAVLAFVGAPFLHLIHYILRACSLPFRFLARFETLYIFFGVACLIGVVTGAALHYSAGLVVAVLKLDQAPAEPGRTLATYRAEKQKKQAAKVKMTMGPIGVPPKFDGALKEEYSDWLRQDKGQGKKGLLSTTILEEDDSSEVEF